MVHIAVSQLATVYVISLRAVIFVSWVLIPALQELFYMKHACYLFSDITKEIIHELV